MTACSYRLSPKINRNLSRPAFGTHGTSDNAIRMKILLHTCCAVCLAHVSGELRTRGVQFTAYFYNPNVHPLIEWRKRLLATRLLSQREDVPLDVDETYGLVEFLRAVVGREEVPSRCEVCYTMRLSRTAERAKALGFDGFSTTLLASTRQDVGRIRRIGADISKKSGLVFLDDDWRDTQDAGMEIARRMSLYRQQYCGCVYSEYDRFKDTRKRGPQSR